MPAVADTMLDPGWMVERTAQQLVQARRPQVPAGKNSIRRHLRLRPLRLILPTAFCPYLRLGLIRFGFSIMFGSMLSISIFHVLMLLAAGSNVWAAGDIGMNWLNQYRYAGGRGRVRLHEGWDGIHSTQSLDSEMVVSFDNDLGGRNSRFVAACTIKCHQLMLRGDG